MTKEQIEAFKKITPGPWKVEHGKSADDFIVSEQTGNTICEPNDPLFAGIVDEELHEITLQEALANAEAIAAIPDLLKERWEFIASLKEMREVCAACFRVLSQFPETSLHFEAEMENLQLPDGFGVRAQELIKKSEGE